MTPVWIAGLWVSMGRRRPLSGSIANAHTLGWVPATHLDVALRPSRAWPLMSRYWRSAAFAFSTQAAGSPLRPCATLPSRPAAGSTYPFLLRERLVDLLKALLDPG